MDQDMLLPNKIPIACPFNHWTRKWNYGTKYESSINIEQETIIGHIDGIDSLHINLPSACNDVSENGIQYILPCGLYDINNFPLLPVICNNGNTILNPILSFERYSKYFSSFYMYDIGIGDLI